MANHLQPPRNDSNLLLLSTCCALELWWRARVILFSFACQLVTTPWNPLVARVLDASTMAAPRYPTLHQPFGVETACPCSAICILFHYRFAVLTALT